MRFDAAGRDGRPRAGPDDRPARARERRVRGQRFRSKCSRRRKPCRRYGDDDGDRDASTLAIPRRRRARRRRTARRARVDGAGRAWRRRALPRRVSVRLRGAARLARACAAARGGSRRGVHAPGNRSRGLRPTVQKALEGTRGVPVPSGGFAYWPGACETTSPYLTAYLLHVFQVAADLNYDVDARHARPRVRLPAAVAHGAAAGERGLVAGLHGVAGVRGEGARGRRTQPGLEHHAAVRLSRPDAGVRAGVPARRAAARARSSGAREDDLRRRIENAILPEAGDARTSRS